MGRKQAACAQYSNNGRRSATRPASAAVIAQAAPQHQIGAARHDVDGVNLQHLHAPDGGGNVGFARARRAGGASRPVAVSCRARAAADESWMSVLTDGAAAGHWRPSYNVCPHAFCRQTAPRYVHQIRPLDPPHGATSRDDRAVRAGSGALRRWTQDCFAGTSSYGYDIRCADEFKIFTNINSTIVDPKAFDEKSFVDFKGDVCIIPPNSFALARTVEYFRIPRSVLTICVGKSTYARCGIIVNVTPFEPEWEGYVTTGFSNTTPLPAKIYYAGEGCARMLFSRATKFAARHARTAAAASTRAQSGMTLPKTRVICRLRR